MLLPLMFACPPAFFMLRQAAVMRHAMVAMPPHLHIALMRAVYGF